MISLEGLSRAIHDARVAPHEFELDERVPGNVVLTLDAYEMRHRVLLAGGYDSELNAQRDRVAAIFGQAHEKAIADVLSVVSTTNWFFVECIAACRAVEDGRKDVEYLHRLVDVGQNVVSAGPRSQAWSRAIHQNFDNVRGLFRQSI